MDEFNEKLIAGKERLAEIGRAKPKDLPATKDRLPPGQHEVKNRPVLDLGMQPNIALDQWTLTVSGKVENPVTLSWTDFLALPQVERVADFHCVTTWSRFDNHWRGVAFSALCELVRPKAEARFILCKSFDGYSTNLPLDLAREDLLLVHTWEGESLTREHGGPVRGVVSKVYAWKGAKWIKEIIFLPTDLLGFWELRGYSNTADPWTDDRYS